MKTLKLTYWLSTGLTALLFAFSSYLYLSQNPELVLNIQKLGYPVYFLSILGVAKLLGAVALIIPKFPKLKEWAYAGFVFNLIGAFWSHLATGDVSGSFAVIIPFLLVIISYITFHKLLTESPSDSVLKPAIA